MKRVSAILAIWNDCAPEGSDHYEHWYTREHLIERVDVPGFRFGRRYQAIDGAPQFFTYYEVDGTDVLASPAYMERQQNPTPATIKSMTYFRNMNRTVCDVAAVAGVLSGSHVVTLRFAKPLRDLSAAQSLVRELAQRDGIGRVHVWTAAQDQTPPNTNEMQLRDGPDASVPGVLAVECVRRADAEKVAAEFEQQPPSLLSIIGTGSIGIYSFICAYERSRS